MKTENIEKIDEAIAEALRFIQRANSAKARIIDEAKTDHGCYATKEMGALKRSAIDLGRVCTGINQLKSV